MCFEVPPPDPPESVSNGHKPANSNNDNDDMGIKDNVGNNKSGNF